MNFIEPTRTDTHDITGGDLITATKKGEDQMSVAEVSMYKYTTKKQVVRGEVIEYDVDIQNTGDVIVQQLTFTDLLGSELGFMTGSVKINGLPMPGESILTGVKVPILGIGEKLTLSFQVKVMETGSISNQMTVNYMFRSLPNGPEQAGSDTSNRSVITGNNVELTVRKEANVDFAMLGDNIQYSIIMSNQTNVEANNIVLKDMLARYVELVPGSFRVNGRVVNAVDLEQGVNIGSLKPREMAVITYEVKVVSTTCNGKIENGVELQYVYILPDGSIGYETLRAEGEQMHSIDMGISNFKQLSVESYLMIPEVKPDVEAINVATGAIDIKRCHVIETPINLSVENQRLTGYKLVVHGILKLVIEYTALDIEQSVHSAQYNIPFSTFIVLPEDYIAGSRVEIEGIVEDIYYSVVDIRTFFQNTTALINVKILMC